MIRIILGLFSQPTLINLFIHNNLNCPRWTIMIGSVFEIALDRVRKILTIAIALERNYAVFFPSQCYVMDHYKFAYRFCMLAVIWGTCDSLAMVAEDSFEKLCIHRTNYSFRSVLCRCEIFLMVLYLRFYEGINLVRLVPDNGEHKRGSNPRIVPHFSQCIENILHSMMRIRRKRRRHMDEIHWNEQK
ncbi:unnamed protein product [Gongylonema pulchrum]|uniref:G_PROTEIN_RECEP_F1_2 domain-containing protein n=1 Tax=Gongylonema pulchrum TaxID=637853 RepID=A0A183DRZ4_9BILA|nr:unnamed protein product [Gongylonema pulchrum]